MTILFTILHVIVCLFLILVVLAQQGKGQDLASAFGGAGTQAAFGARGTATLLSKITAAAAIIFMITSLTLSYLRPVTRQMTVVPEGTPAAATTPAKESAPSEKPPEGTTATEPAQPAAEKESPPPAKEEPKTPEPQPKGEQKK